MEQNKLDTKPKKRFLYWTWIWSWIFGAMTAVEANSSDPNIGWFTTVWLTTMLCLILATNEYILLARENALHYAKVDFEKLLDDCLNNPWDRKKIKIIIKYFECLLKADKWKLINDLDLMTRHLDPEIERYSSMLDSIQGIERFEAIKQNYINSINRNTKMKQLYPWLLKKFQKIYTYSFI